MTPERLDSGRGSQDAAELVQMYTYCFASTNVHILTPAILDSGRGSQDAAERSGG